MFITLNNSYINLDNVTNVLIDQKNKKVIFNMNYCVRLDNIITADYSYWRYEYESELELIKDRLSEAGFIEPNIETNRWVNTKNVASIKTDDRSLKVIFNLTCSITHPEDVRLIKEGKLDHVDARLTSDYVFYKFDDVEDYDSFVSKTLSILC